MFGMTIDARTARLDWTTGGEAAERRHRHTQCVLCMRGTRVRAGRGMGLNASVPSVAVNREDRDTRSDGQEGRPFGCGS